MRPDLLCLIVTLAQTPPAPPAPPASAAEADELQRALSADAAATAPAAPQPVIPPAGGAAGASLMNPDIAFIADFALAAFSSDDPLETGAHDPRRNGFNLQQLELAVGKAVDPYFRLDANLVFSQFGVEIEEAYATTLALPYNLQLRMGQFLTRVGRINPTHLHVWDFLDQPFEIGRLFGSEGNRGLGLEASYLAPLPWYVELVVSATDPAGEATARSFFGAEDLGVRSPLDLQTLVALKQFFPFGDDQSLAWGLSGVFGPNPTGHDTRTDIYGTDIYLKYRPISEYSFTVVALTAEWFYRRRQIPDDVLWDVGGYTSLFWRFAQRWATGLRYEYGSPSRNQEGEVVEDYLDPLWLEPRQRWTAAVTFWPTEFSRLRLQGSADNAGWRDQVVWAAFLGAEFVIGAHGAHKF